MLPAAVVVAVIDFGVDQARHMTISSRDHKVLNQVVTLHVATAEPVGSKMVCSTRVIPFSPATIRNIMMRLEDSGYLSQPHTSAGRLPTDLGYRTYVNDISMAAAPPAEDDRRAIDEAVNDGPVGPSVLRRIAESVRGRTKQMAFHLPLRHSGVRLRHIHLERLNQDQVLALWISRGGRTFETVLPLNQEAIGGSLVEKCENYLNNAFKGFSLLEIDRTLRANIQARDLLMERVAQLTNALLTRAGESDDIQFDGLTNLLHQPEFQDVQRIKLLLESLEEKDRIVNVVRRGLEEDAALVFYIGNEMKAPRLQQLTLALVKISHADHLIGAVGLLGPKRMPYLKALQMLSYAREQVAARPA